MYSIENELTILRQFVKPEHMDSSESWRCYSEDELSAAEERLHTKLPLPIRGIYLYMADLLICSNYLRPLELVHWDKDYLAFFENPNADKIVGIKRDDSSGDIYAWEETDPEDTAWEYVDDFITAYGENEAEAQEAMDKFQEYWEKLNADPKHGPLQIEKLVNEPRYNHTLDGYSLFLAIDALCEWEEMASQNCSDEPAYYAYAGFTGHTKKYFQDIDCRIRTDFIPLSDYPELLAQEIPMQMAYVHKNPDALLLQADDWGICVLLTKTPIEREFLEKMKEQTGLVFRIRS